MSRRLACSLLFHTPFSCPPLPVNNFPLSWPPLPGTLLQPVASIWFEIWGVVIRVKKLSIFLTRPRPLTTSLRPPPQLPCPKSGGRDPHLPPGLTPLASACL